MLCPECNSDSVLTLSSQVCGTITVRRRQCKACRAEWLARVSEEIIQGSIVLAKSDQKPTGLASPPQKATSPQSDSGSLDLFSGLSKPNQREGESHEPPLMVFPTVGKARSWNFERAELNRLAGAFPALDILAEARKAYVWLEANKRNQKTPDGMSRFLFTWMTKAQNNGAPRAPARLAMAAPEKPRPRQPEYKSEPFRPQEEWPRMVERLKP